MDEKSHHLDEVAVLVDAVDVELPCPEIEEGVDVGDVIDEEDGRGAAVERVRDRAVPLLAAGVPHDEPQQSVVVVAQQLLVTGSGPDRHGRVCKETVMRHGRKFYQFGIYI